MKNSWSVYLIVAVLSVIAAVAIAGTPNAVDRQATIAAPVPTTSTTVVLPETTIPVSVATTAAPTDPDPATPDTTTTSSTTTSSTTTTLPEIDRSDVGVVAVNGASISGIATQTRNELQRLGYTAARPTDGTTIVDETVVYYFPSFERHAELVAQDLDLDPSRNTPIADAPEFPSLDGDQVVVYLGRDSR